MNDEIKEILEFKENADYKRLSVDEIVILQDYITNLQQENEKLKQLIQWLEINIKKLKRQKADNLYMQGVKQGMIKNGELILGKARSLLDER